MGLTRVAVGCSAAPRSMTVSVAACAGVAERQSRRSRSTGVHQNELRAKSRDLRRNAWAAAGVEAFVSNAIRTGIGRSMLMISPARSDPQPVVDWCEEADAAGLTDYTTGLACRAMLEGGECLVRLVSPPGGWFAGGPVIAVARTRTPAT